MAMSFAEAISLLAGWELFVVSIVLPDSKGDCFDSKIAEAVEDSKRLVVWKLVSGSEPKLVPLDLREAQFTLASVSGDPSGEQNFLVAVLPLGSISFEKLR